MSRRKYKKPEITKIETDIRDLIKTCKLCPNLFVWEGKKYVKDNSLLPSSEDLSRKVKMLTDFYVLHNEPVVNNNLNLKIKELAGDISWFDKLQLISIEHPEDMFIGVTSSGKNLSYKNPIAPLSYKSNSKKVNLNKIMNKNWRFPDDFYSSDIGDYLELDFGKVTKENLKLIIVDPVDKNSEDDWSDLELVGLGGGNVNKTSIHVKLYIGGYYKEVEVIHTRADFYPDIVDLSPYANQIKGNLKIRLEFTDCHKVAFVGVDTTSFVVKQNNICELVHALHSEIGDVTDILKGKSKEHIKLMPNEDIELKFTPPKTPKKGNRLSYILVSKGYYIPLSKLVFTSKKASLI